MKVSIFLTSVAFSAANAQVAAYGQCGGTTYSGVTSCTAGYYCTSYNPYYYQCIPGTGTAVATTPTKTGTTLVTTTKVSTTSTKSTTATTAPKTSTTTSGAVSTFTSYAKVSGHVFSINGKAQYWMGTNSYWIGFLTNNADVDLVMSHLVASGLKVLRVWGFNDVTSTPGSGTVWYQSFVSGSSPVINTGANGLQRLDYVVKSAEAHGISLIINFVNNWSDYGGMQAYATYYGIPLTSWYTSSAAQAQYKAYIKAVVSRYTTSKAIFAWELANEPRCGNCDPSIMTNWITTISAYIKSLDSNHMVCLGDEGFGLSTGSDGSSPYSLSSGTNFTTNLAISTIDFGTFHLYPGSWGESVAWGAGWVNSHATAAAAVGKPVILEEYGSSTKSDLTGWQAAAYADVVAGHMYWQYGDTLSTGQTSNDGNTIYYGTSDYTTYVTSQAAKMNAKAV